MHIQYIFVLIVVLFCADNHVRTVPIQQPELSLHNSNNITKTVKLLFNLKPWSTSTDCFAQSHCVNSVCQCDKGWYTRDDDAPCSYEQKSKLVAFLLSFFLGNFGADWFYLSAKATPYIVAGLFKLIAGAWCGAVYKSWNNNDEESGSRYNCLSSIWACDGSIWWLVDWIRILSNSFPDGTGVPLSRDLWEIFWHAYTSFFQYFILIT